MDTKIIASRVGGWVWLLPVLCLAASLRAATYYVSPSGNDDFNGLAPSEAWATIDRGQPTKLKGALAPGATNIFVNTAESFATNGTLKIDSELIAYGGRNATNFFNLSAAVSASHTNGTWVFDNDISGGNGFDPGDVILVASGVYTQRMDLTSPGTAANPITYLADGTVTVAGVINCISLPESNAGDYNVIDGFRLTGASSYGIYLFYGDHCTIRNCSIYKNAGDGIWTKGADLTSVSNCNLCFNGGSGFNSATYGSTLIRNCNIVGNYGNGAMEYAGPIYASNNCFYGNGGFHLFKHTDSADFIYDTEAAINTRGVGWSNNIVRDPGFSDLNNNWNFNQFYSNSPCLSDGSGGSAIGAFQGPPVVPTSTNTYYVNASGGDDGRTVEDAQNSSTPWLTISRAARTVVAGDTVVVASGNYAEEVMITNSGSYNSPVTFRASGTATVDGGAYAFHLSRVSDIVLEGFKLFSSSVAGLFLEDSSGALVRNVSSYSNPGKGIYMTTAGRHTFEDINVYSNSSYGIHAWSGQNLFQRMRVWRNTTAGIYLQADNNSVWNSDIYKNTGGSTYGINSYGQGESIINCNVISNGSIGIFIYPGHTFIGNCIVASNANYGVYSYVSYIIASNNCFFANSPHQVMYRNDSTNPYFDTPSQIDTGTSPNGTTYVMRIKFTNSLVADPMVRDMTNNDFRLRAGSPCIDAGRTPPADMATDLYGNRRVMGGAVDIGSFEWSPRSGMMVMIR